MPECRDARGRIKGGDLRYGLICPKCAGPKTWQARECWDCWNDERRGELYWQVRTCVDCGGPKSRTAKRCQVCALTSRESVVVGLPQPADHPWRTRRLAA